MIKVDITLGNGHVAVGAYRISNGSMILAFEQLTTCVDVGKDIKGLNLPTVGPLIRIEVPNVECLNVIKKALSGIEASLTSEENNEEETVQSES